MYKRQLFATILAAACFGAASPWVAAQTKPMTLIIPFAPGGPSDQLARAVGQKVTELSGVTVIVDNKPGGGGQVGAAALKNAPANGLTLFLADVGVLAVNKSLYKSLSFHPLKDFEPVTLVARSPMVLLVPGDSSANSAAELVSKARSTPAGLSYASQGVGTGGHLLGEMFKRQIGVEFVHVPYKGAAPAIQDLVAGRVDFLFEVPSVTVQYVKEGRLKALAIASDKRSALLPNVPTLAEAGISNVSLDVWWGLVVKAGTPAEGVKSLAKLLRAAIDAEDIKAKFSAFGINVQSSSAAEMGTFLVREINRMEKVVKDSGASVD